MWCHAIHERAAVARGTMLLSSVALLLAVALGQPARAATFTAPPGMGASVDTILVKFRDDAMPANANFLPADFRDALLNALGSQFSIVGQARDGAFRLKLNAALSIDQVRAAMNRISEHRAVLYTNVELPPAAKQATIDRLSPAGRPVRQLIVKFREQRLSDAATREIPLAATQLNRIAAIAGVPASSQRGTSRGEYVVGFLRALPPSAAQALASRLELEPDIEYADPDHWVYPHLVPNDPRYATNQWHYKAPGTEIGGANLPAAWDITTGSASIIVGVIDTGALPNHPDLAGKYVGGYDFIFEYLTANDGQPTQPPACTATGLYGDPTSAPCILDRDSDASDPGDWLNVTTDLMNDQNSWFWSGYCGPPENSSWHGTHVSGTIGALSNNSTGVTGINWASKILPLRVLGKCGGYTSDINDAITWGSGGAVVGVPANPNVARVLNLSLGGMSPCGASTQTAINGALSRGTVVVISAGNSNDNSVDYSPGNCPNVITVGASQRQGYKSHYSNYGSLVQISAPGGGRDYPTVANYWFVDSTLNSGTTVPSTYNYVGYAGTSMAAPHVAGIASLMLSVDPSLTPATVLSRIRSTARAFPAGGPVCDTDSSPDPNSANWISCQCNTSICGAGLVDAQAAVAASVPAGSGARKLRDFNNDGKSDLVWKNAVTGQQLVWLMNGGAILSNATLLTSLGLSVQHTPYADADSRADILWRDNTSGQQVLWLMNGVAPSSGLTLLADPNWTASHTGDFNGDTKADIVWRNATTGETVIWLMDGYYFLSGKTMLTSTSWTVAHVGDFNGDGKSDLLWRNSTTGETAIWIMNGTTFVSGGGILTSLAWTVTHTGDFNADNKTDLVWRNSATGDTAVWLMNGTTLTAGGGLLSDPNWTVTHVVDLNGDGRSDIAWRNTATGALAGWLMNGAVLSSGAGLLGAPWQVVRTGDYNGDGKHDLVLRNFTSGEVVLWLMNGTSPTAGYTLTLDPNWNVQ